VPDADLPTITVGTPPDAIPPAARWRERDPDAAARLSAVREAVAELAESHQVLAQNLLASDVVRRLAWQPPQPVTATAVGELLGHFGARPWQVELTTAALVAALT
jgi:ribonuclease D